MNANSHLKPDSKPVRQDQGLGNPAAASPKAAEVAPAEESGRIFSGKSELGSIKATLRRADPNILDFEVTNAQKASYSLQYLGGVMKANPQTVDLWFTSKAPLKLRFQLSEAGGYVDFYLAPRAEEK